MDDPRDGIDRLFDAELEPDPTGCLATLAHGARALGPRALALVDGEGGMVVAWWPADAEPPAADTLRADAARALADLGDAGERSGPAGEGAPGPKRFAVVVAAGDGDGDDPGAGDRIVGWTDREPSDRDGLMFAARLAGRCVRHGLVATDRAHRLRQLRNELDALSASHERNVADLLETKESQVRQQREYVLSLEREVERRSAALREALARAEAASAAKSAFLANMSHEIRTPMTAILGYADLLAEPGNTTDEAEEYAAVVRRNGHALLALLDDVLDIAEIEAGVVEIRAADVDPRPVLDDALSEARDAAQSKSLPFGIEWDSVVPRSVRTDAKRLQRIVRCVVGNAVKFTDTGRITVRVTWSGDERAGYLAVEVIDTGIGMTAAQLEELFRPFTQADPSTTRRHGGPGLGLAIARGLARRLEGDVTAESEPKRGSTFRIEVAAPASPGATPPAATDDAPIVSEIAGDEDIAPFVRGFLRRLPDRIAELERNLAAEATDRLVEMADEIAREAGTLGFPVLVDLGDRLAAATRRGDFEALRAELDRLRDLAPRLSASADRP